MTLALFCSACSQIPRHEDTHSHLIERANKTETSIAIVTESVLRPLGLAVVGSVAIELAGLLRREALEPMDRMRRFKVGRMNAAIELDVDESLKEFTGGLVLRF